MEKAMQDSIGIDALREAVGVKNGDKAYTHYYGDGVVRSVSKVVQNFFIARKFCQNRKKILQKSWIFIWDKRKSNDQTWMTGRFDNGFYLNVLAAK